jgi:hypothetical protein
MRIQWILFFGGLGMACQGCGPLGHVGRTLFVEPTLYPRRLDDLEDQVRNKKLAEEAWVEFQEKHQEAEYSKDFALAFKAGYADYLYAGGSGAPPPVPPRYYWKAEFEAPQGHEAIRHWFEGFRAGAALAASSGYRELVTLPSSLKGPDGPPASAGRLPGQAPVADEVLPPPQKVPPKQEPQEEK